MADAFNHMMDDAYRESIAQFMPDNACNDTMDDAYIGSINVGRQQYS